MVFHVTIDGNASEAIDSSLTRSLIVIMSLLNPNILMVCCHLSFSIEYIFLDNLAVNVLFLLKSSSAFDYESCS